MPRGHRLTAWLSHSAVTHWNTPAVCVSIYLSIYLYLPVCLSFRPSVYSFINLYCKLSTRLKLKVKLFWAMVDTGGYNTWFNVNISIEISVGHFLIILMHFQLYTCSGSIRWVMELIDPQKAFCCLVSVFCVSFSQTLFYKPSCNYLMWEQCLKVCLQLPD